MDRRKKAIILASLFIISVFLVVTVIPQTSFIPALPGTSTYSSAIGAKADPNSENYPYWWNTSYAYRQEIIFNNTASPFAVVNRPVDIFMTFASGRCNNGTVRVQYWNSNSSTWSPGDADGIPYQIWNATYYPSTTYYSSFTITFYVNVSAYSAVSYFVYYDSGSGTTPSFPLDVSVTGSTGNWTFYGQYYQAYTNTSLNGGKIYTSYNNVSGSNQWAYDDQFHWDTEYIIDILVTKGIKKWFDTWVYDTSNHSANSTPILQQQGPLFIMYSTVTILNLTNAGTVAPGYAPSSVGYANITYRFFKWGWIVETNITFTQTLTYGGEGQSIPGGKKLFLIGGTLIGNSWRFNPYLNKLTYKYGVSNTTIDPFTGQESLGEPYWFTIYNSTSGQAVGVVDLMILTLNGSPNRNWNYLLSGTNYSPEKWERTLTANLTINDNVNEKYALYIWDASGGDISSFEAFADGISFIERESAPLTISIQNEEYIHYTVYVHVTDYDGSNLANANVTVYNGSNYVGSKITNATGYARFYLEPETYNFNGTWNGTTSYERNYKNSTSSAISADTTIELVFSNITTLWCRTQYDAPDYNPIQNAYINLTLNQTGQLVDSSHANLTGWAEFHINRSSVFGNYSIEAFYDDNTPFVTSYLNISIDSIGDSPLNFTESIGSKIYTYIVTNETTSLSPTWGTPVYLKIWWRDQDGNNLSTSSVGGSLNWTLNFINGTPVTGPTTLSPQGSAPDIYYLLTVPSSLLFGGVTYQVYINAEAPSTNYLPAANQTIVAVQTATLNVTFTSLTGPYYWKHSDILLWAYVTNNDTGQPITSATVTFSITGTSVSGQLVPSSPSGNYTYTIPASVVGSSLNAASYGLRFAVSNTNYTSTETIKQLVVTPALTEFLFSSLVIGYYGDVLSISVIYRDAVDKTPISTGSVTYSVVNRNLFGSLSPSAQGNWTGTFDTTLLYSGYYVMNLTAYSTNYQGHTDYIPLVIQALPIEIMAANIISSRVYQNLSISIRLIDTFDENITNATAWYVIRDSNGTPVVSAYLNEDPINNGTYYNWLILEPGLIPPGSYVIDISAFKENYTTSEKLIQLSVLGAPTVLSASSLYFSSLNNPAVFFFGNFGQTENSMPFVIFTFRFADNSGSEIPNASVSAFGWPVIPIGNGYYLVMVPTFGLPPSTYPIAVSASANLYEPQQTIFLLTIKEKTVLIPLFNVRVPYTMFLIVFFSVAIPVSLFTGYVYVKRAKIPAIIRRIDQLILAMNRGEKVEVKLVPRVSVTSRILAEALSIVGVEPRVAVRVSVELLDRLTPLLVESGMAQNEAYTLAVELKKATPAERERLLESVGVPGETSARIIKIIEEEEDKAKVFIKPPAETPKPETEKETETEKEGKARTRGKQKQRKPKPEGSSEQAQVEEKPESTEERKEPEGFDTFFDDSNE